MRALLLVAVVALSGCTAAQQRAYDCPPVEPSSRDIEELEAAAKLAGATAVDRPTLNYCRQRSDGKLHANWIVRQFDSENSGRRWDEAWCWHDQAPGSGWTCKAYRLNAVRLTMPDSRHFTEVVIPPAMPADEGRRLSQHGLAQWPALTVANACHWNRDPAASFELFRKHASNDGQWRLEPQRETGRLRLLRDDMYFIDFVDPAAPAAGNPCWGVLEFLE